MQIEQEIGRTEASQRKAFAKACSLALKRATYGSGWRSAQGKIFCELDGWFCQVDAAVWVGRRCTTMEFHAKPMALDPLFWDICGIPQNNLLPLSFRATGSWTCRTPAWSVSEIAEPGLTPDIFGKNSLEWARAQTKELSSRSIQDFHLLLQPAKKHYTATLITSLCLAGKFAEARELSMADMESDYGGGFGKLGPSGQTTFFDMVLSWLDTPRSALVLH